MRTDPTFLRSSSVRVFKQSSPIFEAASFSTWEHFHVSVVPEIWMPARQPGGLNLEGNLHDPKRTISFIGWELTLLPAKVSTKFQRCLWRPQDRCCLFRLWTLSDLQQDILKIGLVTSRRTFVSKVMTSGKSVIFNTLHSDTERNSSKCIIPCTSRGLHVIAPGRYVAVSEAEKSFRVVLGCCLPKRSQNWCYFDKSRKNCGGITTCLSKNPHGLAGWKHHQISLQNDMENVEVSTDMCIIETWNRKPSTSSIRVYITKTMVQKNPAFGEAKWNTSSALR